MISFDEFKNEELIPAIVQDVATKDVLMLAYMNEESLKKTLETGRSWFWSRSRQELWCKGETSGNRQFVKDVLYDCDEDTILLKVEQVGPACHTGHRTCFYRSLMHESEDKEGDRSSLTEVSSPEPDPGAGISFRELFEIVADRMKTMPSGSYTVDLLKKGPDEVIKKVGEEATEVVMAAAGDNTKAIVAEVADLLYHLCVLMAQKDINMDKLEAELAARRKSPHVSS